ncbi:MAG: ArsA family ATPase, partial [Chloroflexi bacterium]|nr:ArsA family ATPase [Chloroflexota bacterium]
LEKMRSILSDSTISTVRLVVNPEKMVIKETQRTFTYLNLYGYCTDLLVCNRVIPSSLQDRFFDSWKASQAKYMDMISEYFDPIPIIPAPLMDQEVVGLPVLRQMAQAVFGERDPVQFFYSEQTQKVSREDGSYVLTVAIPFMSLEDISVVQNEEELALQVGHYRRNILLPRALAGLAVAEAKKEGAHLKLKFHEAPAEASARNAKGGTT